MKDQLEDFIRQNKVSFDDQSPADKNWEKIRGKLFVKNSLWNSVSVWRAAAVILLGACIYLTLPKLQSSKENLNALNEFKDIESFYISQIANKVNQIEDSHGQAGLNGFTHDFQQLEAMYEVLKEEMKVHPSQKVKDALVLNLLVQIDLLNQQLHTIEQDAEQSEIKSKTINS